MQQLLEGVAVQLMVCGLDQQVGTGSQLQAALTMAFHMCKSTPTSWHVNLLCVIAMLSSQWLEERPWRTMVLHEAEAGLLLSMSAVPMVPT